MGNPKPKPKKNPKRNKSKLKKNPKIYFFMLNRLTTRRYFPPKVYFQVNNNTKVYF